MSDYHFLFMLMAFNVITMKLKYEMELYLPLKKYFVQFNWLVSPVLFSDFLKLIQLETLITNCK